MCDGRHVTAAVEDVRATCAVSYLETRVSLHFVVIYDDLVSLFDVWFKNDTTYARI